MLEALAAALLLINLALAGVLWRLRRQTVALNERVTAAGLRERDEDSGWRLWQAKVQAASAVAEVGVSSVQSVHQAIASIPFNILEAIPATRAGAKAVRGVHDAISGGIYSTIKAANQALGGNKNPPAAGPPTAPTLKPQAPADGHSPPSKPPAR